VLRLELRNEPAAIEVIDPLTRGSLFHDTQFEILSELKKQGLLPLTAGASLQTALSLVDEALEKLADTYRDKLAPAIPRVWDDGINTIRLDLHEWLRRMAETHDGWIPDKFELSFGLSDRGPRSSDPASVDDPVEIIGDLRLRGSIDMVERHNDLRFRVTDHKTGKARADRNTVVGGGKHLQPLLYALACEKLLNGKVDSGRLYYCTTDGGYEQRIVRLDEQNTETLGKVLSTIRQGLIDGFLPAAPDKDACTWCDYLAVCGDFEEQRVRNKPAKRLIQIKALRDLS
jgi:ATP-dependent helicase/nuclease subunit B